MLWGMKCPLCQNEIARPPTFKAAVDMHVLERGITHRELARQIGISASTFSRMNEQNLSVKNLARVALAIGMPLGDALSYFVVETPDD